MISQHSRTGEHRPRSAPCSTIWGPSSRLEKPAIRSWIAARISGCTIAFSWSRRERWQRRRRALRSSLRRPPRSPAERLNDSTPALAIGPIGVVTDLVGVDHVRAELTQDARGGALPRADPAGQTDYFERSVPHCAADARPAERTVRRRAADGSASRLHVQLVGFRFVSPRHRQQARTPVVQAAAQYRGDREVSSDVLVGEDPTRSVTDPRQRLLKELLTVAMRDAAYSEESSASRERRAQPLLAFTRTAAERGIKLRWHRASCHRQNMGIHGTIPPLAT